MILEDLIQRAKYNIICVARHQWYVRPRTIGVAKDKEKLLWHGELSRHNSISNEPLRGHRREETTRMTNKGGAGQHQRLDTAFRWWPSRLNSGHNVWCNDAWSLHWHPLVHPNGRRGQVTDAGSSSFRRSCLIVGHHHLTNDFLPATAIYINRQPYAVL